jgi:hypothetical protein
MASNEAFKAFLLDNFQNYLRAKGTKNKAKKASNTEDRKSLI